MISMNDRQTEIVAEALQGEPIAIRCRAHRMIAARLWQIGKFGTQDVQAVVAEVCRRLIDSEAA